MRSKSKNLSPKSSPLSSYSQTSEDNNYRPSVPIFVYRQLVEELKKTQFNLETLTAQNRALVAQNEELKKELSVIFNSAQNLQEIIDNKESLVQLKTTSALETQQNNLTVETDQEFSSVNLSTEIPLKPLKKIPARKSHRQKHTLEVDPNLPNSEDDAKKSGEIQGFWLMILIVFLFFSCFVGSFFVAKSFLNDNNNSR
jgi:hypothetical protein